MVQKENHMDWQELTVAGIALSLVVASEEANTHST
jgi:hypothetical protein